MRVRRTTLAHDRGTARKYAPLDARSKALAVLESGTLLVRFALGSFLNAALREPSLPRNFWNLCACFLKVKSRRDSSTITGWKSSVTRRNTNWCAWQKRTSRAAGHAAHDTHHLDAFCLHDVTFFSLKKPRSEPYNSGAWPKVSLWRSREVA